MKITRFSPVSRKHNTREIDITPGQLQAFVNRVANIQDLLPHLSADDREFLLSGCTPEDWNLLFPAEEEGEA